MTVPYIIEIWYLEQSTENVFVGGQVDEAPLK